MCDVGIQERPLKSRFPCVCSPSPAGCGTHALLVFWHALSTRRDRADGDGSAVRQSSPATPALAALLGRLSRGAEAARSPAPERSRR